MARFHSTDEADRIAVVVDRDQEVVALRRQELRGPRIRRGSVEELGGVENELLVARARPLVNVTPGEMAIYASAGLLRAALAQKYSEKHGLFRHGDFRFLWVTNFPMFEYDEENRRFVAAHHPFTSPHEEDMDKLESDPAMVRALAYDVVLNGTELGSGSIRIHRQDIQKKIFHALGLSEEEAASSG